MIAVPAIAILMYGGKKSVRNPKNILPSGTAIIESIRETDNTLLRYASGIVL